MWHHSSTICPETPQQNGTAQKKHQHILKTGLTMIFNADIPLKYWDSFFTAVYLIKQLPYARFDIETPYFKLYNKAPDYSCVRIIECQCFPYSRKHGKHKFMKETYSYVSILYTTLLTNDIDVTIPRQRKSLSPSILYLMRN